MYDTQPGTARTPSPSQRALLPGHMTYTHIVLWTDYKIVFFLCVIEGVFHRSFTPFCHQGTKTFGQGQLPPKTRYCLQKCDETLLTNSKHRHIGAKRSFVWPIKYAKMRFRPGWRSAGEVYDAPPDPLVGWGRDAPPHTLPPLGAFGASILPLSAPRFEGGFGHLSRAATAYKL